MDDETTQEITADLEADASAGDTQDTSQSDQNTGEEVDAPKKEPKLWQVVRGLQKSVEDINKSLTENPKTEPKADKSDFDLEDVAVLVSSVPVKEDRELVKEYARFKKVSLEEAMNDPVMKTLLKDKAEQRRTAEVTNISGSKRTTAKVTDEQIVEKAAEGKEFDPEALAIARMNLKKQQVKR